MTDQPTSGKKLELPQLFEYLARGGAILLGAVYVSGFLVVSFNSARFGMSESGFVRPHIFAAGALFLLLTGLPCYVVTFMFRPQWLPFRARMPLPNARPIKRLSLFFVNSLLTYSFICYGMALSSNIVLFNRNYATDDNGWFLGCALFIGAAELVLSAYFFDRAWYVFIVVSAGFAPYVFWLVHRSYDHYFFALSLWYFAVGLGFLWWSHSAVMPEWRVTATWEYLPFLMLSVFTAYSTFLYQGLKPEIGGGAPRSATLFFSAKNPLSEATSEKVSLIEEIDAGFYVLLKPDASVAYYVRRDLVSAIKYGEEKPTTDLKETRK